MNFTELKNFKILFLDTLLKHQIILTLYFLMCDNIVG